MVFETETESKFCASKKTDVGMDACFCVDCFERIESNRRFRTDAGAKNGQPLSIDDALTVQYDKYKTTLDFLGHYFQALKIEGVLLF